MADTRPPLPPGHQNIFRTVLTADFTTLPNAMLRDKRLSFKARGMLGMILSNKPEWEVHQGWLIENGTEGREAVSSAVQECEALGYAVYSEIREGGKIKRCVWTWHDTPVTEAERTNRTRWAESPSYGKPWHGKPCDGKPCHGFPTTKKDNGTEELSPEKQSAFALFPEPPLPQKAGTLPLPPAVNTPEVAAAWEDFKKHRREKRQTLTPTAEKMAIRKLEAIGPARALAALIHSTENGYTGVFEPDPKNGKNPMPAKPSGQKGPAL